MPDVIRFTVVPRLPERLERLRGIAHNFYWCWLPEAIELFIRLDRNLWETTNQNPVRILGEVTQERLEELAKDESFCAHLDRVWAAFQQYLSAREVEAGPDVSAETSIAYFSAEFGIHESLSNYSGGLGVLSGDHLKTASDMNLPLVGVGLLYREGYLKQYLTADGWQQERYPRHDFHHMAVEPVTDAEGKHLKISLEYPEREVFAQVWQVNVGRLKLYLLDSDCEPNDRDDREITSRLYGGDINTRIRQEILMGMGGAALLSVLGIKPTVYHMNEGHSAFLTLQRIKDLVNGGLSLNAACEAVKSSSVFTTHTPVPAGIDIFPTNMIEYYFSKYVQQVGMPMEQLLGLGRQDPRDPHEPFCMAVLAMRLSSRVNGVSELHGRVSRAMWTRLWPDIAVNEVPIGHVTNGVHTRFWVSRDLAGLYDRYLGPRWATRPEDEAVWERVETMPDAELWRTHERRRERLIHLARKRLANSLAQRGAPQVERQAAVEVLDPDALTIGFARRFATYKRANLFMMQPERLKRILTDPERPVQLIIAGKAHPADTAGKDLIRNIIHFIREHDLRNHIVFLEDYDMNVARYMVQGVDCWLNTPRRPMEASGTSGMKAAANGALNISIPDGWWCEANPLAENGWSIGRGEDYSNTDEQDLVEVEMLYRLLESEIVPLFYDRQRDNLPRGWLRRMKNAIKTICPRFSSHRMMDDYIEQMYEPVTKRYLRLAKDEFARARALADWKQAVRENWAQVRFVNLEPRGSIGDLKYGASLTVKADLHLGGLKPGDVLVEVRYGALGGGAQEIAHGTVVPTTCTGEIDPGVYRYEGVIPCDRTGLLGFGVRAMPSHPDIGSKYETSLVAWA